jgi:glycosyltransferase involved in cell wall biosynthesis
MEMKTLFVYKYLTLGGVESVLRARLEGLPQFGIQATAWFLEDGPGRSLFSGLDDLMSVGDPAGLAAEERRHPSDVIVSIDTEEIFPWIESLPGCPPLALEMHTPNRENRVYLHWLGKLPIKAFFVPSQYQLELTRRVIPGIVPVQIIPNPLRTEFADLLESFASPPPRPVIAWVGRLDSLKNWRGFIKLARELIEQSADVEFWLVGHGQISEAGPDLYHQAHRSKVLPYTRWYRDFPPNHMVRLYDAVRDSGGLVVSTSRVESFGMTLAEAMARGCPVVAPDGPPFTEFVFPAHGALYRPGLMREAAKAIQGLLNDPQRRRSSGLEARQAILARHAPENALPLLAEALMAVAAGQVPGNSE